ncbi:MAG: hypothetical protein FWH05_08375 [Oscillospiraceae bacterium]|nr:hypothetical protein [Oscillospiraceae bacterium]
MRNKEYIINFKFGNWRNQIWFNGVDDSAFENARNTLDNAVVDCKNSSDFFLAAVKHFESHGFERVKR